MEKTTRNILIGVVALVVVFIVVFAIISTNNQNKDNEWSNRCRNELAKMGYDDITDFSCESTAFGDDAYCDGSFRSNGRAYTYWFSFTKVGSEWIKDSGSVSPIVSQLSMDSSLLYLTTDKPYFENQFNIAFSNYFVR